MIEWEHWRGRERQAVIMLASYACTMLASLCPSSDNPQCHWVFQNECFRVDLRTDRAEKQANGRFCRPSHNPSKFAQISKCSLFQGGLSHGTMRRARGGDQCVQAYTAAAGGHCVLPPCVLWLRRLLLLHPALKTCAWMLRCVSVCCCDRRGGARFRHALACCFWVRLSRTVHTACACTHTNPLHACITLHHAHAGGRRAGHAVGR